jgi:acetyltransferase-like isoleucine patch superfamily enzyme
MSLVTKLRKGEGPFWSTLKKLARKVLTFHLPVNAVTRPFFSLLYLLHVGAREGLVWALRFFWFEPLFRTQCAAVGEGFRMEHLPCVYGNGQIIIGNNVHLAGKSGFNFGNRVHASPEVRIGDGSFIGHACSFSAAESITIGNHCLLAGSVRIADFDGHPVDASCRRAKEPAPREGIRPVVIGDDVWLGAESIILKGVTIGPRSIVGAGSVVTRDVPPDVVVAGNPARVVKHLADPPVGTNGHGGRAYPRGFHEDAKN